ncbi:MAG: tyrosine-type recombinase/integrase, partial [Methylocystis sp.]
MADRDLKMLEPAMPKRLPPGCVEDRDRHGNPRVYYRAKGHRKVRLRGTPWTPEFMAEYEAAKTGAPPLVSKRMPAAGTWRWLCMRYMLECAEFKRLSKRTAHVRKLILEGTYDEPVRPGADKTFGDMPVKHFDENAVEVLRDRKIEFPEAANSRVKAIRQVFKWARKKKDGSGRLVAVNPTETVSYFKSGSTGWHTWTVDEVRKFEERHPIGTKARLALALLLFTGQRRSDMIRFSDRHVQRDGTLAFTQFKGRNRSPTHLVLPILPCLCDVLDASPLGKESWLETDFGKPFSDAGIGNKIRQWCDEAGLPHCTAHGLRKAGATIAAENGATAHQLMAIFGWKTLKQAEVYTKAAEQKR